MKRSISTECYPKVLFFKINFSLIELLVVIAIISILMTLLLPALKRTRDVGKKSVCASNQKQIGVGIMGYCNDHDGRIPAYCSFSVWDDDLVGQYLGTQHTYYTSSLGANRRDLRRTPLFCPADPCSWLENTGMTLPPYPRRWYWGSSFAYPLDFPILHEPLISARVKHPSQKFILGDAMSRNYIYASNVYNVGAPCDFTSDSDNITRSYHLRGANYLYIDGHVMWIREFGSGNTEMRDAWRNYYD